ncbi:MAG: DUF2723 domain-containing protein [Flavobacteriaceae bacterium]|nr:DUF2723 domain-containing protein [Flavobacteriaceae bacterium]
MVAKNFKKINTLSGWGIFAIALIVYTLTVEPTGSFWDAGEYISTSAKLQVGHPPGAPLFQMIGAFFAMFAMDASQIAFMVNFMSVVSSAFAVLFTFWTITNLSLKLFHKEETLTNAKAIAVLGAGVVGALALTFSDSFWFNAVETEVYAMASLLMALQLWLGLRWYDEMDTPHGNRWLILISFVIGCTFGVQFMGFLAIPSIVLLYYFKRYKTTTVSNFLVANIAAIVVLMIIYKFALTYVLKLFGWAEVFFVNSLGMPFNSGTIIMGLLFVGAFYYGLRITRKKQMVNANTLVLCVLFIFVGFSSWMMLPIRANANVVINENNPQDARSLLAYYNREQYPSVQSPIYGTYYTNDFAPLDSLNPYMDDKPFYEKDVASGKYVIINDYKGALQSPNSDHVGILPRMWSGDHAENYMKFQGIPEFSIKPEMSDEDKLVNAVFDFRAAMANGQIDESQYIAFLKQFGDWIDIHPPSFGQNLGFMLNYQLGDMYWRYFMWNFVGKQDDIQWRNDNHGNWISGFRTVDSSLLGVSQENLPSEIENNKGRNTYYFLPLLLGLIGILFQISKNPKMFWMLLVFFLFTGIAIQIYTNPYAFQPRERDYSLVGSFYIFTIWIGLGVYAIFDFLKKYITPKIAAPAVSLVCLLAVPMLLAAQNWDDHDRSNRYTARSMAKAYLDSVDKDAGAMLFTIGDNDTFALWYAQEIENYRTDVRTINTSLFATDWYIDQMRRKVYESEAIPSSLTHKQYRWGTRDAVYLQELTKDTWDIDKLIKWIASDKSDNKLKTLFKKRGLDYSGYPSNYINQIFYPTRNIRIPVNKENVLKSGLVKEKDSALIVDYIDIKLPGALSKNRLMMLDIIANNDWKRPIYFTGGSFDDAEYIWMKDYLQLDGLTYKLVPIKTENKNRSAFEMGRIDSEKMYDIVSKWEWGNSGSSAIYHDTETRRNSINFRGNLARLLEALLEEGKLDKAEKIIDIAMTNMPVEHFGYYVFVEPFLDGYYKVGKKDKARTLFLKLAKIYQERLDYYAQMSMGDQTYLLGEIFADMEAYRRNVDFLSKNQDLEFAKEQEIIFKSYIDKFSNFMEEDPRLDPLEQKSPIHHDSLEATKDTVLLDSSSE